MSDPRNKLRNLNARSENKSLEKTILEKQIEASRNKNKNEKQERFAQDIISGYRGVYYQQKEPKTSFNFNANLIPKNLNIEKPNLFENKARFVQQSKNKYEILKLPLKSEREILLEREVEKAQNLLQQLNEEKKIEIATSLVKGINSNFSDKLALYEIFNDPINTQLQQLLSTYDQISGRLYNDLDQKQQIIQKEIQNVENQINILDVSDEIGREFFTNYLNNLKQRNDAINEAKNNFQKDLGQISDTYNQKFQELSNDINNLKDQKNLPNPNIIDLDNQIQLKTVEIKRLADALGQTYSQALDDQRRKVALLDGAITSLENNLKQQQQDYLNDFIDDPQYNQYKTMAEAPSLASALFLQKAVVDLEKNYQEDLEKGELRYQEAERKIAELEIRSRNYLEQITNNQDKNNKLQDEIANLKDQLNKQEEISGKQLISLQKQLNEKLDQLRDAKNELGNTKNDKALLNQKIIDLQQQVDQQKELDRQELLRYQDDLKLIQERIKSANDLEKIANENVLKAQEALKPLQIQKTTLENNIQDLNSQKTSLEETVIAETKKIQNLNNANEELKKRQNEINNDIIVLNKSKTDLEALIAQLEIDKGNSENEKKERDAIILDIQNYTKEKNLLKKDLEKFKEDIKTSEKKSQEARDNLQKIRNENSELIKERETLEENIANLINNETVAKAKYTETNLKLVKTSQNLIDLLNQEDIQKRDIKNLTIELQNLRKEKEDLESSGGGGASPNQIQDLNNQIGGLTKTIIDLNNTIQNSNTKNSELQEQLDEANEKLKKANEKIEELETKIVTLNAEISGLKSKIEELEKTNKECNEKLEKSIKELKESREKNAEIVLNNTTLSSKNKELEEKIKTLKLERDELSKKIQAIDNQFKEFYLKNGIYNAENDINKIESNNSNGKLEAYINYRDEFLKKLKEEIMKKQIAENKKFIKLIAHVEGFRNFFDSQKSIEEQLNGSNEYIKKTLKTYKGDLEKLTAAVGKIDKDKPAAAELKYLNSTITDIQNLLNNIKDADALARGNQLETQEYKNKIELQEKISLYTNKLSGIKITLAGPTLIKTEFDPPKPSDIPEILKSKSWEDIFNPFVIQFLEESFYSLIKIDIKSTAEQYVRDNFIEELSKIRDILNGAETRIFYVLFYYIVTYFQWKNGIKFAKKADGRPDYLPKNYQIPVENFIGEVKNQNGNSEIFKIFKNFAESSKNILQNLFDGFQDKILTNEFERCQIISGKTCTNILESKIIWTEDPNKSWEPIIVKTINDDVSPAASPQQFIRLLSRDDEYFAQKIGAKAVSQKDIETLNNRSFINWESEQYYSPFQTDLDKYFDSIDAFDNDDYAKNLTIPSSWVEYQQVKEYFKNREDNIYSAGPLLSSQVTYLNQAYVKNNK